MASKKYGRRTKTRTERLDLRVTPEEREILQAKCDATHRTLTSIVAQLIDEIDKIIPQ